MARRLSILWLAAIIGLALLAPLLSPHPPNQSLFEPLAPPGKDLPLGADALGRDFLARMLYGARLSLLLTGLAVTVTLILGGLLGFSAAIVGGRYETAVNWLSNVLLAIPGIAAGHVVCRRMGARNRGRDFGGRNWIRTKLRKGDKNYRQ